MKHMLDRVARHCIHWAGLIVPSSRRAWVEAMTAEFEAVEMGSDRACFALGCLYFAVSSWSRSRQGLAWIGRCAIATGLSAISVVGAHVSTMLDGAPRFVLIAACCTYLIGGVLALRSLRGLRSYSIVVGAIATSLHLLATGGSFDGRAYYAALTLEAGALMAGLLFGSTFLMLVRDREDESM